MSKIFYQTNIHKDKIPISVIVSLSSDSSLENLLLSMKKQTHRFFEILFVAKSITIENSKRISDFEKETGIATQTVVAKERTGLLLNKAIILSNNSYIVFLKSKYCPRPNFLSALIQSRFERECYAIAGNEKSFRSKMLQMSVYQQLHISHFVSRILKKSSFEGRFSWSWAGTGCWKKNLIAVNGFNESLNSNLGEELRIRLNNIGVLGRKVLTYSIKREDKVKQCSSIFVSTLDEKMYAAAQRNKLNWSHRGIDSVG